MYAHIGGVSGPESICMHMDTSAHAYAWVCWLVYAFNFVCNTLPLCHTSLEDENGWSNKWNCATSKGVSVTPFLFLLAQLLRATIQ